MNSVSDSATMSDTTRQLLDEVLRLNPMHKSFIGGSLRKLTNEERTGLDNYVEFLVGAEHLSVPYIASCYDLIVKDTFREQLYFMRNKRYRYSTYDEVKNSVYLNDTYMTRYMYGLAISAFLWPQHCEMKRWFSSRIPKERRGKYLEIGPGHGYYFMESIRKCAFDSYLGVDISPTSIRLTKSIIENELKGGAAKFELRQADFLSTDLNNEFAMIVMGEVLEHVENPSRFIAKIKEYAAPDAFIYVTTVINAAAIDHISLFTGVEDLENCIDEGGLRIREYLITSSNEAISVEDNLKEKLPVNIAMVLESS